MLSAEFFDIFGVIIFAIILGLGCLMLKKSKKKTFRFIGWSLLVIGIIGTLIDGIIVFKTYVLGR